MKKTILMLLTIFLFFFIFKTEATSEILNETIGKTTLYTNHGATPKEIIYYSVGKEVARKIFLDVNGANTTLTGKIPDGAVKVYWDNGTVWLDENYIDGKLCGLKKTYFYNGKLAEEENYKDGKQDGYYKRYYYPGGSLLEEGKRKEGKYDGLQTSYYRDGKVEHEIYFDFEKYSIDYSRYYHKNGKIKSIETYKNNKKISLKIFDESGKEISSQDFPYKEELITPERVK